MHSGNKPTQTHLVYVMGFKKQILKLGGTLVSLKII